MTKSWLKAKATRWRNWSLPVITACHHSDSAMLPELPVYAGRTAGMTGNTVCGVLYCSVSHAVTPSCWTCWIRLVVGPKVVWSSSRAAAVSLIGAEIATSKRSLTPPVKVDVEACTGRLPVALASTVIWASMEVDDT